MRKLKDSLHKHELELKNLSVYNKDLEQNINFLNDSVSIKCSLISDLEKENELLKSNLQNSFEKSINLSNSESLLKEKLAETDNLLRSSSI